MDFRTDSSGFALALSHDLWAHAKGPFTPAELRIKQAVWEWYSGLTPQELERASLQTAHGFNRETNESSLPCPCRCLLLQISTGSITFFDWSSFYYSAKLPPVS